MIHSINLLKVKAIPHERKNPAFERVESTQLHPRVTYSNLRVEAHIQCWKATQEALTWNRASCPWHPWYSAARIQEAIKSFNSEATQEL